jgi:toxin ParE1/3/4
MATVFRRPAAERDLEEIAVYLGQRNPTAATRFLDAADRTFALLASMPGLGSAVPLANPQLQGLRQYPVQRFRNYLIFYLPTDDGIEVVRVLHGARDVQSMLEAEP